MGLLRVVVPALLSCALVACGNDADGDGHDAGADCNDDNAAIHPDALELCNGVDDNCDGGVDVDPVDGMMYFADADGDGWGKATMACTKPEITADRGGDCHDDNANAWPGSTATEVPKDGIDTDCDGNDFCTDLNCDGRADLIVPSHHDGDYQVTQAARLLSGPGGWSLDPAPISMSGTLGVAAADLDDDGYQEIVHASYNNGTSVVTDSFIYWGAKGHAAGSRTGLPTNGARWVCIADFDGNGKKDVLFVNYHDGDYDTASYIYRNRAGAFSPLDRIELPTTGGTHCGVDDLNNDSYPDIVISSYYTGASYSSTSYIYWGSAAADYPAATRTELPTMGSQGLTIADVDSDGRKDIVFWSHYDGTSYNTDHNYIYWNRAAGFSSADRTQLNSFGGFHGTVADLNGDGHNEIIATGYHNAGWANMAYTYIYWGNAANMYSSANRTPLGLKGVLDVTVDDINNDGYKDILLPAQHDGDSYAPSAIFWGTAGGTFNDANRTELPGYHVVHGSGIADFNHDGYKDVFLPGYHNNMTGADPTPWANQAYSRIYWGSATGLRPTFFDQWPTRGAWSAQIVGN